MRPQVSTIQVTNAKLALKVTDIQRFILNLQNNSVPAVKTLQAALARNNWDPIASISEKKVYVNLSLKFQWFSK